MRRGNEKRKNRLPDFSAFRVLLHTHAIPAGVEDNVEIYSYT